MVLGENGRGRLTPLLKPTVHETEVEAGFDGEANHCTQPFPIGCRGQKASKLYFLKTADASQSPELMKDPATIITTNFDRESKLKTPN